MRQMALALFAAAALAAAEPAESAPPPHVLTNDGLILLARAGLGDALLTDLVRHKQARFDTSPPALARLAWHGLSETVIRAVVERQDNLSLRPAPAPCTRIFFRPEFP